MRRAIGVVGTVVVAATMLASCTGSPGAAHPSGPTLASARALLAEQSAAVLAHDRAKFLATLDTSSAARTFRTEQASEFSNLAGVPLGAWRYRVVGPVHDNRALRAASARYGAPVLLLDVTLGYELRGIDTVADTHDQYLSIVTRGGHALVAGNDALASENTASWLPPWHYGPLVAAHGTACLVLGPPGDHSRLPELAAEVDSAIAAVTAVWGTSWSRRVAVLIPSSTQEFQALSGASGTDVSAAAVTGGIDPATGRPFGQRLVLNPAQLDGLTTTGRAIVLRHEITHLASAADTADITPRWLVEGFADYVANLRTGQPVRVAAAELHAVVAAGRVPVQLPADDAFGASGSALARAYEQSWLACRLIAQRVGQRGLVHFYRAVGTAIQTKAQAVAHGFGSVLHETQSRFTAQWRAYLKTELS
jgi:hypothetical protein